MATVVSMLHPEDPIVLVIGNLGVVSASIHHDIILARKYLNHERVPWAEYFENGRVSYN